MRLRSMLCAVQADPAANVFPSIEWRLKSVVSADAASLTALKAEAAATAAASENQEPSLVRAPVKHVLSKELQLYFDRVARILRAKPGELQTPCGMKPATAQTLLCWGY